MKATFTIEVTQVDIDLGRGGNCAGCPLARALRRVFGGHSVWVDGRYATITSTDVLGYNKSIKLSLSVESLVFIQNFDWMKQGMQFHRHRVQPGAYRFYIL